MQAAFDFLRPKRLFRSLSDVFMSVEVIKATEVVEAVEVIEAAEVPDAREITQCVNYKQFLIF